MVERNRLRAAGHRVPERVALQLAQPGAEPRFAEWATSPLGGRRPRAAADHRPRRHAAPSSAERRLAEEHAFLEAVLDTAAGPIVVLGPDGRLLRVNAATARLAGMTPAAMIGRTPWELGLMTPRQAAEVSRRAARGPRPVPPRDRRGTAPTAASASSPGAPTAMRDADGADPLRRLASGWT